MKNAQGYFTRLPQRHCHTLQAHFGEVHFRGQSVQPDGVQRSQQVFAAAGVGMFLHRPRRFPVRTWELLFRPVRETLPPEWPCSACRLLEQSSGPLPLFPLLQPHANHLLHFFANLNFPCHCIPSTCDTSPAWNFWRIGWAAPGGADFGMAYDQRGCRLRNRRCQVAPNWWWTIPFGLGCA